MASVSVIHGLNQNYPTGGLFRNDELVNDLVPGGEDFHQTIAFGEDRWDLAGHASWKSKAGAQVSINFGAISERWRDTAKAMALLQMNPALAPERAQEIPMAVSWPHIQEPVAPITAQANIKMLSHALRIIDEQQLDSGGEIDWSRLKFLLVQPFNPKEKRDGITLSPLTGRARAQQIIALWQVTQITRRSDLLGTDPPFEGRDASELFRRSGNRNVVRPHESVGEALGFVAWFFDHIAEDVVAHIEWWASTSRDEPFLTEADAFAAMLDLVANIAAENEGKAPGSLNRAGNTTIAAATLGRLIGINDADEAYLAGRWAKSQLGDTVDYSLALSPCPLPISLVPHQDGSQIAWTDRLMASRDSLDLWQRRLVYFAMYYLSATVMLRDSQLAVLPFDPLRTEEIIRPSGETYSKHTLSAFNTKNRRVAAPTTVTVNGRVAHIIQLLHRLQAALGYEPARSETTGALFLFDQRLAMPRGQAPWTGYREGLHLDAGFLLLMKRAARELYDRGVIARNLDDVAFSMRHVRITCAQAYAVREHGQALAAAFGQWDTAAVAGGYIGDVYRLITPIDPAETRDIAHEDIGRRLRETLRDRENLTGSGLGRLDGLTENGDEDLSNPAPLTPARLKALGKRNLNIEQGPLTLCLYQPEGALCGGKGKPDFRLCLPGQCRNSVMSRADRARYELMRRQHLALGSEVLRRAADKMHDANPDIAGEFADMTDQDVQAIIAEHIDGYIKAALEDKA